MKIQNKIQEQKKKEDLEFPEQRSFQQSRKHGCPPSCEPKVLNASQGESNYILIAEKV